MKAKLLLIALYILTLIPTAVAQLGLTNGDLEQWRRREFRCCGRNVDLPVEWGIPEESCGLNFNKFVFIEQDTINVHSGLYSAMLYSDTSFFNNVGLQPGMLVYGGYQNNQDSAVTIGQPIPAGKFGLPIDTNPVGITFWLKMDHGLSDTFSYRYMFTRWDSTTQTEDTLAYGTKDIPDTQVPMDQWFSITDSFSYRHAGKADTARLIFYGGRFGDLALQGNVTWIDDISFYYVPQPVTVLGSNTGIVPLSGRDAYTIYPNPASDKIRILSDKELQGDVLEISDNLGRIVSRTALASAVSAADISHLAPGTYICRLLGTDGSSLYQSKVAVVR